MFEQKKRYLTYKTNVKKFIKNMEEAKTCMSKNVYSNLVVSSAYKTLFFDFADKAIEYQDAKTCYKLALLADNSEYDVIKNCLRIVVLDNGDQRTIDLFMRNIPETNTLIKEDREM